MWCRVVTVWCLRQHRVRSVCLVPHEIPTFLSARHKGQTIVIIDYIHAQQQNGSSQSKQTSTQQRAACAGWYLFGRRSGLNTRTAPGASRKGQFCAVSKVKSVYTEAHIAGSVQVTTICNGEGLGTDPKRT